MPENIVAKKEIKAIIMIVVFDKCLFLAIITGLIIKNKIVKKIVKIIIKDCVFSFILPFNNVSIIQIRIQLIIT